MRAVARWKLPLAVTVLLAIILALVLSGQWPELRGKLASSSKGLVAIATNEIERVDIRSGAGSITLRRQPGGWTIEGVDGAAPPELVSRVDTALKFLRVSQPSREIPGANSRSRALRRSSLIRHPRLSCSKPIPPSRQR